MIEAHVIPESFFRPFRAGGEVPLLLTNTEGQYPKRSPIGVYDSGILCDQCEPGFGPWDTYAQEFLKSMPSNAVEIQQGKQVIGYEVASYRYDLLKLFFISLLWRASVSKHLFYKNVRLGPYETEAKKFLQGNDPGAEHDFSVTLAKFDGPLAHAILDPCRAKWDGVNYYHFYLGGYIAYIKADHRESPQPHLDFAMKPDGPLKIIGRNFVESKELALFRKIAQSPNNLRRS